MLSTWINHLASPTQDQYLYYFNVLGHPFIWTAQGNEHLVFALQCNPSTGQMCEQWNFSVHDQVLQISNAATSSDGFFDNLRVSGVISLVQCCGWQMSDLQTPCDGSVSAVTFVPNESRTCLDHIELEYLLQVWSFGSGISALASPRGLHDRPFVFGGQQQGGQMPQTQKCRKQLRASTRIGLRKHGHSPQVRSLRGRPANLQTDRSRHRLALPPTLSGHLRVTCDGP